MNILEHTSFHTDKPTIIPLLKEESIKYLAVGLGKNALLKKHSTPSPATLVMLKGEISFIIVENPKTLKMFDIYEIPVDTEHEVRGIAEQNLFTLLLRP